MTFAIKSSRERLALFYLARGADVGFLESIRRFASASWSCPAGIGHDFVVIFKGYPSNDALSDARSALDGIPFEEFHTGDETFDLGAFKDAILRKDCDRAVFLNTSSEPIASNWLLKLNAALDLPGVGLAGASGSFEVGIGGGTFPNVHVRTNAFMMRTQLARRTLGRLVVRSKRETHLAEHGPDSLTRQVVSQGLTTVIVGANGRAYAPEWWSGSRTFRQSDQSNLLVRDNQTRAWDVLTWSERRIAYETTWGAVRTPAQPFRDPRS